MPGEKVTVYIDGSNLYHSLRSSVGRTDVDFSKFVYKLVGDRRHVRTYYYNAPLDQNLEPDKYKAQQRFFDFLRRVPYLEVRLGRLVYRNWPDVPAYEKGIDIKIATDMIVHASRGLYDVAVLVSGDTDFVDALQAVKDLGRHAEVALFNPTGSQRIREVADNIVAIDQRFLNDCWLK